MKFSETVILARWLILIGLFASNVSAGLIYLLPSDGSIFPTATRANAINSSGFIVGACGEFDTKPCYWDTNEVPVPFTDPSAPAVSELALLAHDLPPVPCTVAGSSAVDIKDDGKVLGMAFNIEACPNLYTPWAVGVIPGFAGWTPIPGGSGGPFSFPKAWAYSPRLQNSFWKVLNDVDDPWGGGASAGDSRDKCPRTGNRLGRSHGTRFHSLVARAFFGPLTESTEGKEFIDRAVGSFHVTHLPRAGGRVADQFSDGFFAQSITSTSACTLHDSSFGRICCWTASKMDGPGPLSAAGS
ncbi:MAG: hypothetical protein ABI972_16375 [Acidobacteriota bacterium]